MTTLAFLRMSSTIVYFFSQLKICVMCDDVDENLFFSWIITQLSFFLLEDDEFCTRIWFVIFAALVDLITLKMIRLAFNLSALSHYKSKFHVMKFTLVQAIGLLGSWKSPEKKNTVEHKRSTRKYKKSLFSRCENKTSIMITAADCASKRRREKKNTRKRIISWKLFCNTQKPSTEKSWTFPRTISRRRVRILRQITEIKWLPWSNQATVDCLLCAIN